MPAYLVTQPKVLDPARLAEYLRLSEPSIAAHGGRFLVNTDQPLPLEGIWDSTRRLIIVEFPDLDAAERWYHSTDYAPALAVRQTALDRILLLADGL